MYIWLFMALISIEAKSTRNWVKLLYLIIQKDPSPGLVPYSLKYTLLSKKCHPSKHQSLLSVNFNSPKCDGLRNAF